MSAVATPHAHERPRSDQPTFDKATGPTEPAAVGVDLGSAYLRIWASGRPMIDIPASYPTGAPTRLVRGGRVVNRNRLAALLRHVLNQYHRQLPARPLVVACLPVLTTDDDERLTRDLLTEVFTPPRLLVIPTVRAAAIGAGAHSGPLLIADVGADLVEVAVVAGGRVVAARRRGRDTSAEPERSVHMIGRLRQDLLRDPACGPHLAELGHRPVLLAGGGAVRSPLAAELSGHLNMAVRTAASPRLAAARGAGLAALSTLRRLAATP
ncbi:ROK family protein [Asanoa sp. NPDC049573]|uniref:ROK family protein n=1 Tax=Asanoa sp. NPDC049573 TaxID=3155396 RepID=UPI003449A289